MVDQLISKERISMRKICKCCFLRNSCMERSGCGLSTITNHTKHSDEEHSCSPVATSLKLIQTDKLLPAATVLNTHSMFVDNTDTGSSGDHLRSCHHQAMSQTDITGTVLSLSLFQCQKSFTQVTHKYFFSHYYLSGIAAYLLTSCFAAMNIVSSS